MQRTRTCEGGGRRASLAVPGHKGRDTIDGLGGRPVKHVYCGSDDLSLEQYWHALAL
jgi:hypothetical protein